MFSFPLFFPPFLLISASCPWLPGLGVSCPPHSGYVSWNRPLFLMVSQILHTFVNSVCAKLLQSCPTLWDPVDCCLPGVHQAPLSTEFSRQEYWSGLPLPPPGDLLHPGIEPVSLTSPAWHEDSLPLTPPGKPFCKQDFYETHIELSNLSIPYVFCCDPDWLNFLFYRWWFSH